MACISTTYRWMSTVFAARSPTRIYRMGEVEVHALRGIDLQVDAGVKPGETVVVYPPDALREGGKVAVRADRGTTR